ncbi:hypothetical protein RIF29_16883 [Crotalaria pallida]|uniref:Uncharacterized protein n=1 Tax=Crotalaria pallida TaxID=3830 RepID=A0AAN9FJL7_CROPI
MESYGDGGGLGYRGKRWFGIWNRMRMEAVWDIGGKRVDFTGVPAVVDLACMRDAMNKLGGDSNKKGKQASRIAAGPAAFHFIFNASNFNARNMMEVMANVRKILEVLMNKENFGKFHGYQIRGISGAPVEPQCMGMSEPLNKLKGELLKDGVSVNVLTGLGGSGKSTLAKKLCWDPQIKGK